MTALPAVQYLLSELRPDPEARRRHDQQAEYDRLRDSAWAQEIQQGNEQAFQSLFTHYVDPLVRFAVSYVTDEDLAREIVADIFLNIWRQHEEWNPSQSVAIYLYGAVRNRAVNAQRAHRRHHHWQAVIAREDDLPGHSVPHESAERHLEREETALRVWRAIDALPEPRRQAVILRWHHGMAAPDIAAVLGMSPGAVYQLLNRAHELLRRLLSQDRG